MAIDPIILTLMAKDDSTDIPPIILDSMHTRETTDTTISDYVHNFNCRLPDASFPRGVAFGRIYTDEEWETPYRVLHQRFRDEMEHHLRKNYGNHEANMFIESFERLGSSDLHESQSPSQVQETVTAAIVETGLDVDLISDLQPNHQKVRIYSFPAYVKLRQLGYTWHDISA